MSEQEPDLDAPDAARPASEEDEEQEVCAQIAAELWEYSSLGDEASMRMPEVAAHLAQCPQCEEEYEALRRDVGAMAAWRDAARSFQPATGLIQRAGRWFRSFQTEPREAELSQAELGSGERIGGWALQLPLASARAWRAAGRPVALTTRLPGQAGEVTATVTPLHLPVERKTVWRVVCELRPTHRVPYLHVGIGSESGCATGMKDLRSNHPVEFEVPPTFTEPYWLYFEWLDGGEQHHRQELPVREAQEEPAP